jgi:hypothetical protein
MMHWPTFAGQCKVCFTWSSGWCQLMLAYLPPPAICFPVVPYGNYSGAATAHAGSWVRKHSATRFLDAPLRPTPVISGVGARSSADTLDRITRTVRPRTDRIPRYTNILRIPRSSLASKCFSVARPGLQSLMKGEVCMDSEELDMGGRFWIALTAFLALWLGMHLLWTSLEGSPAWQRATNAVKTSR